MISVRLAKNDDVDKIYSWRNHEITRQFFFDSTPISNESHKMWFKKSLRNENRLIYIISYKEEQVGVVRFDKVDDTNTWEIDIFLDPARYGKGYAAAGLEMAISSLRVEIKEPIILIAKVIPENSSSKKLFEKIGFSQSYLTYAKEI